MGEIIGLYVWLTASFKAPRKLIPGVTRDVCVSEPPSSIANYCGQRQC